MACNMEINKTGGNIFSIIIGDNKYEITLDSDYWNDLTNEKITQEELIHNSFEFLLKRESADEILKSFNLKVIQTYFPEYEDEMKKVR